MTQEYESAVATYYSKLKIVPVPLISWDLFVNHDFQIEKYNSIQKQWKSKENFREIVYQKKQEIIITDTNFEIVFASSGIFKMNGYHPFEVVGKSAKLFQGKETSQKSKDTIRLALANELPFKEILVNYKKDGSTYLCEIEAYPKFDKEGKLTHYIAFERIAS